MFFYFIALRVLTSLLPPIAFLGEAQSNSFINFGVVFVSFLTNLSFGEVLYY